MKLCLIYLATGLINDKRYIGQTRYNWQTPRIEQRKGSQKYRRPPHKGR